MNRINQLFQEKERDLLNIYFTAGYPQLEDTSRLVQYLEQAGADLVEIGMPYSDPLADGPTIQESSSVALGNGMSINVLFHQLEHIRSTTKLPIILMGYLNPVLQYGIENFLKKCQEVGVDGLILPDLPIRVYEKDYQELFEKYQIKNIFLITPQTSEARIRKIDALSNAFIYVVSTAGTTGKNSGFSAESVTYFERIQEMKLKNPTLIGFGIANAASYQTACTYANGAIIGSAFIRFLSEQKLSQNAITSFIESIKKTQSISITN